jgi:hypothetical protein
VRTPGGRICVDACLSAVGLFIVLYNPCGFCRAVLSLCSPAHRTTSGLWSVEMYHAVPCCAVLHPLNFVDSDCAVLCCVVLCCGVPQA